LETRQDFYVGLLLVVTIALVIGALIATSGWGEQLRPVRPGDERRRHLARNRSRD